MSFSTSKRPNLFLSAPHNQKQNNNKPPSRSGSGLIFPRQETSKPANSTQQPNTVIVEDDEDFFTNLENQSFHDLAAVKQQIQQRETEARLKREQQQQEKGADPEISKPNSKLGSRKNSGSLLATTIVDAEEVNYRKPTIAGSTSSMQQTQQKPPPQQQSIYNNNNDSNDDDDDLDNSAIVVEMMNEEQNNRISSLFPSRKAPQLPPQGSFSTNNNNSPAAKQLSQLELLSLRYKRNMFDVKAGSSVHALDHQQQQQIPGSKNFDESVVEALHVIDSCFKEMLQGDERQFQKLGLERPDEEELIFSKEKNPAFEKELRSMMLRFA